MQRAFTRVLAEPAVQDVVTTLVDRAHARAMQLLRGDGLVDGITVVDGAVTLNLLPLVARGLTVLQGYGLLDGVDVPELTAGGDPDEQAAQLSAAVGRDLPDGFGQLVVYDSEALADAQETVRTAQRMLVLAQRAVWVAAVLSLRARRGGDPGLAAPPPGCAGARRRHRRGDGRAARRRPPGGRRSRRPRREARAARRRSAPSSVAPRKD